ncbi:MAG: tetratricopeptide repeat protein [Terrimicrobiaceae bacterium]|nr:tetratricopeptide repeat protein [Terrimicrobiaceae bacterium]
MRLRLIALAALAAFGAARAEDTAPAPAASPAPTPDPAQYVPEVARSAAGEGNSAFVKGDFKTARRAYRRVLELVPNNLVGLVNLGLVEFRSGNPAEAEKLLKQAVQERLETGAAWLTLGMMYFDQNRIEEAFAALSQAVLYDGANARAHNYLGVVLGRKGWLDGAEAELRRAVEIDPEARDAHYNLAVIYLQRKPPAFELARRHYFRSIELGAPADPDIEKNLTAPKPTP